MSRAWEDNKSKPKKDDENNYQLPQTVNFREELGSYAWKKYSSEGVNFTSHGESRILRAEMPTRTEIHGTGEYPIIHLKLQHLY